MFDVETVMRTTLAIDDDVFAAARELADFQRKSIGEVISALARAALTPRPSFDETRNGIPLLKRRGTGILVTSEMVKQLDEELP